jgi:uncharacterized protein
LNTITAYGDGYVEVNKLRFDRPVVFGPEGAIEDWPVSAHGDIDAAAMDQAGRLSGAQLPEVLLIGTGARQHFLSAALVRPLLKAGVGVEMMDSQAAARTYNILMAEGRRVVIALIPA